MNTHPTAGTAARNQFGTFAVHNATDRQVGFLRSLFETRDLVAAEPELHDEINELWTHVSAGVVSKKAASRGIDILLPLPVVPGREHAGPPASDKQKAFVRSLLEGRDLTGTEFEVPAWDAALSGITGGTVAVDVETLTKKGASETIDALMALPKKAGGATRSNWDAGMYVSGSRILRVYLGQQSGRMLVKEVVGNPEDGYTLEYLGQAAYKVPADARRMSLEEAKGWGRATGTCVKCGRRLDVPESVDAGIGPVCAGKDW